MVENMAAERTGDGTTGVDPALPDARQSLGSAKLDDLVPEGEAFARSLQTFVALLALAAFIASFGLNQDSVASIIGAMVVAPLGDAIMAFAGALVTGRSRWQGIAFLQVALGAQVTGPSSHSAWSARQTSPTSPRDRTPASVRMSASNRRFW